MLSATVATIAQRRVPPAGLVKRLGLRATPGDTPEEPARDEIDRDKKVGAPEYIFLYKVPSYESGP